MDWIPLRQSEGMADPNTAATVYECAQHRIVRKTLVIVRVVTKVFYSSCTNIEQSKSVICADPDVTVRILCRAHHLVAEKTVEAALFDAEQLFPRRLIYIKSFCF